MNIAIASLLLPSGSKIGVGYQVHFLANALVRRGHRVTVFSQTGPTEESLYQVKVIPPRRRLRTFAFAWDLRRERFDEFDVLNAHGDDWFLWGCRRPRHVHTFHGSCLAEAVHAHGVINKLRMTALAACEYNSLFVANDSVAVSRNTMRYIPGIHHVIPCGVDTDAFRPGGRKSDAPSILFVGTMHGRKRGTMLLDAFVRHIRPKIPSAELWCVCQRPDGQPDVEGVRWTGRIDQNTLVDLYRQAWAFCLPSSYEGFGVPYVEAMASGLPVVASPNVGAREVTAEGRYGRIVEDSGLAEALVQLLSDAALRGQLAEAGLERSRAYAWDEICRQYERVYVPSAAARLSAAVESPVQ